MEAEEQVTYNGKIESSLKFPHVLSEYIVPRDEEDPRYIKSFTVDQDKEILDFFKTFGFVVVRDVLSKQDCQNTVDEMFSILETNTKKKFKRDDVSTWNNWPEDGIERYGQIQRPPVFSKATLRNRQNPNVYKVFSLLLSTKKLLVNHDRLGLQRPTQGVVIGNQIVNNPKWRTNDNLHLDMSPWGFMSKDGSKITKSLASLRYGDKLNLFIFENNQIHHSLHNGLHLQGVLNLCDNHEEDGGFQMVPGFYHYYEEWIKLNEKSKELVSKSDEANSLNFPAKDPIQQYAIRIPMREGSLVVWDQRSPHGSKGNDSSRMRCAQFIKMFPAEPMDDDRAYSRATTVSRMIKSCGFNEVSEIGNQVFGLYVLNDPKFKTK